MFGKGVFQEEEILLRDIIRSIDKKLDYSAREGEGTKFSIHMRFARPTWPSIAIQ